MKKSEGSKAFEEFYSIFPWPDDPKTEEGKEYFERAVSFMEKLLTHPWIEVLTKKKKIKILDVCSGVGFGSIALAKVLSEKNIKSEIVMADLREDALKKAKSWGKELGIDKIKTLAMNAEDVYKLKDTFDIALMYGLSTPHFNPWQLERLFSSVASVVAHDGVFVLDESDRRYRIFLFNNYQWVLGEGLSNDKFCVSFQSGYSIKKGTFKRTYINFSKTPVKPIEMETFMWGLAEVGAFMWPFFNDVDLVPLEGNHFFLLGAAPRKSITPDMLKEPTILKENS